VDDEVTANLMEAFYLHLKEGFGRGEALRRAKLEMIRTGRSDPFYWGAFVLYGDDSTLPLEDVPNTSPTTTAYIIRFLAFSAVGAIGIISFSKWKRIARNL
jgi:hypothetical protein